MSRKSEPIKNTIQFQKQVSVQSTSGMGQFELNETILLFLNTEPLTSNSKFYLSCIFGKD